MAENLQREKIARSDRSIQEALCFFLETEAKKSSSESPSGLPSLVFRFLDCFDEILGSALSILAEVGVLFLKVLDSVLFAGVAAFNGELSFCPFFFCFLSYTFFAASMDSKPDSIIQI
uniref:Uncharacterized protein n=1 Tax=Rhizophora mucronata TaxID=61149 RepID=A0A2P2JAX3_RHIMU